MADRYVDIVIAGGSVAGIATAAALREFNYSVLIVEPGQRLERRLAGELIHPLGIAGLQELDLFDEEAFDTAAPIKGFAVFPETGSAKSRVLLPYGEHEGSASCAMAVDFSVLRRNLADAIRRFDNVTVLDGARVTAIDSSDPRTPRVAVEADGVAQVYRCRMVVGADGASSSVRTLAGIGNTRRNLSTIAGYVIDGVSLPAPGFGHVMIGGASVVLAYEVSEGRIRVMFDQPIEQDGVRPGDYRQDLLAALPAPFRHQVAAAIEQQKPLSYRSAEVIAHATSRGPIVLVGDAGGTCHPLTATGMTAGICDALRLRDALRLHGDNLKSAFRYYDGLRRKKQRSRLLVASLLHEVCSRQDIEARVLRAGLIRYWQQPVARPATMAILAMTDDRISSAFRHLLRVMWHGLVGHWRGQRSRSLGRLRISARLIAALGAMTIKRANLSLRSR